MHKITVIAEIGINHDGYMPIAESLIVQAKAAGADIAKFQVYDVDSLFPDHKIMANGKNWYDNVKGTQLTKDNVYYLAKVCKDNNIEFMASAFDLERLGWLEEIGVKRHKIATRMAKDKKYMTKVIETMKPVLVSTSGGDDLVRIEQAYENQVAVLYCIPHYPTELSELNFERISFDDDFGFDGFSDHTTGIIASEVAMSKGAWIIEKHFTYDRNSKTGPDHICSANFSQLRKIVQFARKVEKVYE